MYKCIVSELNGLKHVKSLVWHHGSSLGLALSKNRCQNTTSFIMRVVLEVPPHPTKTNFMCIPDLNMTHSCSVDGREGGE